MNTVDEQLEICLDRATDSLLGLGVRQFALRRALGCILVAQNWSLLPFAKLLVRIGGMAQSILDDAQRPGSR